ncbi:MAG: GNAT family N-acetyltransferase [Bacteroidota bacterium]
MSYRYERLEEKQLPDLAQFFGKMFGKLHPSDYFLKKYRRFNPSPYFYAFLVFHQEEVVACAGAIPYYIKKGEQKELSSQLVDLSIHPAHRGKGIFKQLMGRVYDVLQEDGIRSVFGCPNQNLYRGLFSGMKWQKVHEILRFHVPIQNKIAARLRFQSSRLQQKSPQLHFSPNLSDTSILSSSLESPNRIMTHRNADFYHINNLLGAAFLWPSRALGYGSKSNISSYLLVIWNARLMPNSSRISYWLWGIRPERPVFEKSFFKVVREPRW